MPDLAQEVRRRGAVLRSELAALGVEGEESAVHVEGEWLVDPAVWDGWGRALADAVDAFDRTQPGLPLEAARRAVGLPALSLLAPLAAAAGLESAGGRVRRPGTVPQVAPGVAQVEARLAAGAVRRAGAGRPRRPRARPP